MSFCLYNKKNITWRLEDMNFIFSWQKQYFTHSLFCHSKIKFISLRHRVISSIYIQNVTCCPRNKTNFSCQFPCKPYNHDIKTWMNLVFFSCGHFELRHRYCTDISQKIHSVRLYVSNTFLPSSLFCFTCNLLHISRFL